jgi:uncharacterized protein (TIGR03083 family)
MPARADQSWEDPRVSPGNRGPWPLATGLAWAELRSYLDATADPALADRPSLCPDWTVRQVTAHLAASFARFADQLAKSRGGDFRPPFAPGELAAENARAVAGSGGDPRAALRAEAGRFLAMVAGPAEPMAHQRGPIPVALQVLFGLNELAVHHYDATAPFGPGYRPPDPVLALLAQMHERINGLPPGDDVWDRILRQTGRNNQA